MKKKYFKSLINLFSALKISKTCHLFTIVLIAFLISIDNFAQSISSFTPTNACTGSGTSVVISGTGFTGATAVYFNGVTATYTINSSGTQITATLPTAATTGVITVTPLSGPDISSGTFTVNTLSVPSVTILANPASPICSGTSVTFTAAPVNGGSSPAYKWYVGATLVGSNSPTFTTSSLVNGNQIKVEMTSNAICPSPAIVTSNIITMTVNPLITPSVTIEATETIFCAGTPVTFSVDALTNGGLTPIYQWRLNGTPVGTNSNSFTSSTLSNNDVITLDVTSSASCATPAMVTSNSIQVTVNPNLPASVSIISSDADDTICAGTSILFTATPTNGGTTPAYQWYVGATPVGSNNTTYTTTGLTNGQSISVVMTSNAVCAIGSPATSNTIITTVNPNLPASVSIVSSDADDTICAGTSILFTATPTNGGTTPAYQWYVGATPVGSNSTTYTTTGLTNGQSISVVMTSNAVCAIGSPATSNTIITTVNPNLPASVSIVSSDADNTICATTSITFTATPTNGGTTPAYQWYVGATPVGSNNSTYTTSGLTTGQSVSVVMTSNAVCASGNPATSNAIVTTVNPNLPVSVSIAATATTICAGTSVTFTATPTNGGTTPAYQWQINGVNTGTNSNLFTTSSLTNGQVVTVILTSSAIPCATGNPATSNGITMTVNPNLPVSVSVTASATTICAGSSVTFTATPTNGGATPTYQWQVNGINTGTSNIFTTSSLTNGQVVTVILTSSAIPCATGNPATSTGITMTVNPNLPVSVSVTSSATTICLGTSVTFTATPTNGGTTPAYQWKVNGVNVGTNNNTFTTTTLTNGQIVTVVLTSNATCPTSNPATSNGITMTVNPNLPVSVNIAATATTICDGTSVTFTATPTNGGTTPAYQWKVNGVNAGTNSNTFTTTTLTNGQVVTVVLTSNTTPCATGNPATSNSISITVNSLVTPFVSITSTSTSICSSVGTSVTFTASPTNGGSTPTYQWQRNGLNIAGATNSTYTTTSLANPSTITVVMTSNATCASPTTATSNSIVMTVYTGTPTLPANPISGPTAVCPVASATYSVSAVAGATLYIWSVPTGWVINSGQGTTSITATATGSATIGSNQNITVQVSNPCGTGNSKTFNVDVNTFAAVNLGADISMCSGTSISLNPLLTGNANALPTFTSSSGTISGGPYPASYTYTPSISNGTVTINATTNDPAGGCNAGTDQLVITVNQTVAITSHPVATQTICSGTNVSFSVTATGTGLTYQWKKGATILANGGNISGATSATLTLTGVLTTDAGSYNVVVSGASPCAAVTSSNAILVVNQIVAITAQPAVTQTVCSGNSISFSVTATGTGLTYQWRKGITNLSNVGNISGATTNTLTINPATSGDAADYNVEITGTAPCTVATSNNSALLVNDAVAITSQPATTQTACSGTNVSFSVTATGTGITYQWRKGTTNLANGGNISGATSATLTLTGVLTTDTGSYNVVVSGASPCAAVTSSNAVLVVNQVVAITAQPTVTQTVCSGNSISFGVTATGTGLTYQWRKGIANLSNVGNISGATTNTLTINPAMSGDAAADYNVVITGTAPCTVATSNNSALVVNDAVAIISQPAATQTACSGTNVSFSVTATGTGLTYQWKKGATILANGGSISGATSATLTLTGVLTTDAGSYNIVVSGASPCAAVTSSNAVLVVNQIVAITAQPAVTQTVCSGNSISFSVTATGTGLTYQWRKGITNLSNVGNISGATTNTLTINPVASSDAAADYNVEITGTAPCTAATSNNSALLVNDAVAITSQPATTQTACSGTNVSFSVTATGTGITYQWRKGTTNLVNGGNLSGATSATLTLTGVLTTDAGSYNVVVSGASPCAAVTSSNTVLFVNQVVAITAQPAVTQTVCSGNSISFSVTATGTGLTYQWRKGIANLSNVGNISGATTNTLTINPATSGDAAADYNVVITGTAPCTVATSNNSAVVVNDAVTIISQPAATQTACSGTNVSFSVTATGTGLTYQWRKGTTNLVNGGNLSGATSATLTISNVATTDAANNYNVVITGTSPCAPITSNNAILLVNRRVIIGTQPSNLGICASSTAQFGVVASGDGLTYQWYKGTFPGTAVTNTAFITGAQTNILNFSQAFLPDDGIYYVVVNGTSPCASTKSNEVTLNVDQSILITTQPIAQTVCEGTNISISVAANAGGDPITYQWRKNGNNISGATNATYTITAAVLANAGNYDVVVSGPLGYTCPTVTSVSSALTVTPTVGTPTAITISAGTEPSCQITASTSTTTFATTATNSTGFNWSVSNPSAGTINSSGLMTWTTGFSGAVNIQVTANGCHGPSTQVIRTVLVNPTPNAVAINSAQTICSATVITTIGLSGNVASTTFNWTRNNTPTVTGIAASGSGDISGSLTNTTNTPVTVTFTITPIANGCSGTPIIATVLVNPTPNAVATNAAQTICSTTAITTMAFSGNVAATTYNWTRNNTISVTGIAASGSGNISGNLTNTTNAFLTVTFTITPTANGCNGTPITTTVLVNPTPNAVATNAAQTICSQSAIATMVLSGNVASTTYNWTRDNTVDVTGIGASGSGNISGSLTNNTNAPVTVTFTITPTANGCSGTPITATVIINPTPNAVVTNAAQTICSASAITTMALSGNIASTTFNWTRDNTVSVTGIAISGSGNISGNLTNTTSAPITVTFTITPTANSCNGTPITTTVLVYPTPNAIATPATQTLCSASPITAIVLSGSIPSTTYNWTRDNTVAVTGIASSGSGNISGSLINNTNSAVTVTFTITPTANGCTGTPTTATVSIEAASAGGAVTVSQPSTLPVVRIVTVCHSASGTIYLSGHTGTIVRWESSTTGGASWIPISNTGMTYNYSNILATTLFRAIIQNGSLCTLAYSSTSIINVIPNIKPSPVTATPSTICNGDSTILSSQSSYATSQSLASGGAFDTANPKNWLVDGCGNCLSAGGSNTNPGPFQESATNGGTYSDINYTSSGKFVIANGNFNSILQTPVFNTLGLSSASLHFDHAYNLLAGASAKVEISIDGGTSYNAILAQYNGPATQLPYTITTNMSIDLSAYLGQTNLKIRFNYQGTVGSSWAIDNIEIPEAPIGVLTSQWVDTNTNTVISNTNATNATVSPTVTTTYAVTSYLNGCTSFGPNGTTYVTVTVNQRPVVSAPPGIICSDETTNIPLTSSEPGTTFAWTVVQTGVSGASPGTLNTIAQKLTTTGATSGTAVYTITPTSNGCAGTAKTVTIVVNPRPTANIGPSQTICYDGTATFNIALTGTAPWTITYSNGTTPTTVTTTTNPYTFNISGITVNKTYTITGLSDANCNPALPQDLTGSATVTVLTGTAGIWTGLVSTDWFDCKNWEQGLPSSTINAVINSGFTNMPVINPSTSPFAAAYSNIASAQDLIIANGASVTMAPSSISNLQISRDWKNSGSFVPGIGTVTFNGATANQIQTINAAIKTNETFYNLTTNNSVTAKGISVVDGFELTVLNNLTLAQGDLRLTGEAQLVQAGIAANPIGGLGKLLRDQQGQKNSFNYNYWSSPVSPDNINYSIVSVLRDGTSITNSFTDVTNFSPSTVNNISFIDGAFSADGALTSPITISTRWLWTFNSPALSDPLLNYYQWKYIGSTAFIKVGEGFTMKGTGGTAAITDLQNYVFVGKPNSGTITLAISPDQTYLVGNPYPSALDADEFIKDNLADRRGPGKNVFNGALYFWDHFGLSNNHLLAEYEGGYSTYTLMGGVAGIADSSLTGTGAGTKVPQRYIPVAQGFFVDAYLDPDLTALDPSGTMIPTTVNGGDLIFKNSQRAFVREVSASSIFMKTAGTKKTKIIETIDTRSKIRLGFDSSIGAHRQLLVGADSSTTPLFDIGYDAPMFDLSEDDMFWEINNIEYVIQAVSNFNDDQIIPLGLTVTNEGKVTIKIDALENISETTKIYLHDNVTGIYHDIRNSNFTISLTAGEYRNRFSLQFTNKTLDVDENNLNDGLMILYSNNYKVLIIQNKVLNLTVNDVRLFNLLGQAVANWDVKNENQNRIQIPIKNLPSGVYIVKLKTSKGDYSKKIIIK
ncbi:PKD-like domain-containing protein [Flavobacterium sp. LB1P71]|uniref:PKD-like domain-containing protein n=1 Tax=Flavobacterium sp. LB1P71 TaxID=3401716 RepID=UPI003AB0DEA0